MDRLFIIPHTHYDAVVFKTRAEYLEMGLPIILHALQALRDDPNYRFVLDQVCYIKPFLERYPEQDALFRRMLAEGRLQITCGMDSMADVNIPSGESFVRQVLYGKGYCRTRLGIDVNVGWALDTFGHHPQMPQLLIKSGFSSYFFARGVPWPPPEHSEFIWHGIDGSRILALWLPYSYGFLFGSPHNIAEFSGFMRGRYEKLKPMAATSNLLGPSGVDLGEPEPHICELARQFNRLPDAPCELVVASPDEFLAALNRSTTSIPLKTIQADLNPIFQGCYSSRIEVKQANRECETLFTTVEKAEALASLLGKPIDQSNLWRAWEPVLFSQFHDCICGVQVDKVYEDTMLSYAYAKRLAGELLEERLSDLAAEIDTRGEGIALVVWNFLGWERDDVVEVEVSFAETGVTEMCLRAPDGQLQPVQVLEAEHHWQGGYKRAKILFVARAVPALGHHVYHIMPIAAPVASSSVYAGSSEQSAFSTANEPGMPRDHGSIENEYYRLEFDVWNGALESLKLKATNWEALSSAGNVIAREQEGGDFWQLKGALKAGMATAGSQRQPPPKPGQALFSDSQVGDGSVHAGAIMAEFRVSHPFDTGWLNLRARVYAGLKRIDLHTDITNNERFVRYRVLFPTVIEQGTITHEIPFGAIQRPEQEMPAQNWVDYSDSSRGLTLINRGIPGNNVDGGVMMLSVLRASQLVAYGFGGGFEPGVYSTTGQELDKKLGFDYALVPHLGDWRDDRSYRQGLAFNNPLVVRKTTNHAGDQTASWGLLSLEPENIVVSALKLSHEGTVVLRVYEAEGRQVSGAVIRFNALLESVAETDLLEEPTSTLSHDQHQFTCDLGAFEIKTFQVRLKLKI